MRVLVTAAAALGAVLLIVPLLGLVAESPWSELPELWADGVAPRALGLSILVSGAAVALSLGIGAPLAWLLARNRFRGRGLLRSLVTLPMVLPPVVAGVALLAALGPTGPLGRALAGLGVELPFTTAAAVLAASFVSAPLLITALEGGLNQLDRRYEQVAAALGASRAQTLLRVVLPLLRPALLGGLALCWARALGEFGATIAFAGNLRGVTQTAPLAIYELLQNRPDQAFLLGALLLAGAFGIFVAARPR